MPKATKLILHAGVPFGVGVGDGVLTLVKVREAQKVALKNQAITDPTKKLKLNPLIENAPLILDAGAAGIGAGLYALDFVPEITDGVMAGGMALTGRRVAIWVGNALMKPKTSTPNPNPTQPTAPAAPVVSASILEF